MNFIQSTITDLRDGMQEVLDGIYEEPLEGTPVPSWEERAREHERVSKLLAQLVLDLLPLTGEYKQAQVAGAAAEYLNPAPGSEA